MEKHVIDLPGVQDHPYSQAIKIGNYVYVSGQIGVRDSETGEELTEIEAQCRQCFENIRRILDLAESSLRDVAKVTVFIRHASYLDAVNKVFQSYFPSSPPARSTVVTDLVQPNMLVEIECISYCSSTQKDLSPS